MHAAVDLDFLHGPIGSPAQRRDRRLAHRDILAQGGPEREAENVHLLQLGQGVRGIDRERLGQTPRRGSHAQDRQIILRIHAEKLTQKRKLAGLAAMNHHVDPGRRHAPGPQHADDMGVGKHQPRLGGKESGTLCAVTVRHRYLDVGRGVLDLAGSFRKDETGRRPGRHFHLLGRRPRRVCDRRLRGRLRDRGRHLRRLDILHHQWLQSGLRRLVLCNLRRLVREQN